jgi:hypothetical protein
MEQNLCENNSGISHSVLFFFKFYTSINLTICIFFSLSTKRKRMKKKKKIQSYRFSKNSFIIISRCHRLVYRWHELFLSPSITASSLEIAIFSLSLLLFKYSHIFIVSILALTVWKESKIISNCVLLVLSTHLQI